VSAADRFHSKVEEAGCANVDSAARLVCGTVNGGGDQPHKKKRCALLCRATIADGPPAIAQMQGAAWLNTRREPWGRSLTVGVRRCRDQRKVRSDGSIVPAKGPFRCWIGLVLPQYWCREGSSRGAPPPTACPFDRGRAPLGPGWVGQTDSEAAGVSARQRERSRAFSTSSPAAFHDGRSPAAPLAALHGAAHCLLLRDGSGRSPKLGPGGLGEQLIELAQLQQLGHGAGSKTKAPATGVRKLEIVS